MSEGLHVTCKRLRTILTHIKQQIPHGNKTINVAVEVVNNQLYFTTQSIILYRAHLGSVEHSDLYQCVQYFDISPFVGEEAELNLKFDANGIELQVGQIRTYLHNSYDLVSTEITMPTEDEYDNLDTTVQYQLKSFKRTFSVFKLYKHEYTALVKDREIVLKTPSLWFKGRCSMDINAMLTPEVYDLFLLLAPKRVHQTDNILYIANDFYVASLPINCVQEDISFKEVHKDYKGKSTLSFMGMQDMVSSIASTPTSTVQLAFSSTGFAFTINSGQVALTYTSNGFTKPEFTCEVTKDVLCFIMKLYISTQELALYYKGNLLCFYGDGLMSLVTVV